MSSVKSLTDQNLLRIKLKAGARLGMLAVGHPFARCLVNEYPKSGGSWLAKMVATGLGIDFPQNVLPTKFPAVFHGHYMREFPRVSKLILWRDPRDIMVSWYYHCLFENERNNIARVAKNRARLNFEDVDDIRANMAAFVDWCFGPDGQPEVTWAQFYDQWHDARKNVIHTSYERLRATPVDEMERLLAWLGLGSAGTNIELLVESHSFDRQTSRRAGEEKTSSFLRKGIVGDWKNVFDDSSEKRLRFHLGSRLAEIERRL